MINTSAEKGLSAQQKNHLLDEYLSSKGEVLLDNIKIDSPASKDYFAYVNKKGTPEYDQQVSDHAALLERLQQGKGTSAEVFLLWFDKNYLSELSRDEREQLKKLNPRKSS